MVKGRLQPQAPQGSPANQNPLTLLRHSPKHHRHRISTDPAFGVDDIKLASFFSDCSDAFLTFLVDVFQVEKFLPGQLIIREGDIGHRLFYIIAGSVDVIEGPSEVRVATLGSRCIFGESALLDLPRCTTTIKATEPCDCRSLDKDVFRKLLMAFPDERLLFENMGNVRKAELEAPMPNNWTGKRCLTLPGITAKRTTHSKIDKIMSQVPSCVLSGTVEEQASFWQSSSEDPERVREERNVEATNSKFVSRYRKIGLIQPPVQQIPVKPAGQQPSRVSPMSKRVPPRLLTFQNLPSIADLANDSEESDSDEDEADSASESEKSEDSDYNLHDFQPSANHEDSKAIESTPDWEMHQQHTTSPVEEIVLWGSDWSLPTIEGSVCESPFEVDERPICARRDSNISGSTVASQTGE